jgi:hypothetical protein
MLAVAFDGPTALVALKQVLGVPERSGRADTEHDAAVAGRVTTARSMATASTVAVRLWGTSAGDQSGC